MKTENSQSFLSTMFEVLSFYKSGNWNKFNHSFNLSVQYFNLQLSKQIYKKLRQFALSYFRSTGFITVCYTPHFKWSTSEDVIVQIKKEEFAAIGRSEFRNKFYSFIKDDSLLIPYENPLTIHAKTDIDFYPNIPVAYVRGSFLKTFYKEENVKIIFNYASRLFKMMPHINEVRRISVEKVITRDFLNPESTYCFDFENLCWNEYNDFRPQGEGLFRKNNKYCAPEYYLAQEHKKHLQIYEITNHDWIYLIAAIMLRLKLEMIRNRKKGEISIKFGQARMPDILEQILRSRTLSVPKTQNGWKSYIGLDSSDMILLCSKLQIFSVEDV